ncbi:ATP-binding protein [Cellulomonas alba]|uniref:BTAD domain-containing putative transcriptional regulator n=1 Tax=Cellulomonas alba TaxID=3053467 RepID=A0ABT7SG74_9CELL|nr:BTAD domain-containing putative transcriptional regulator [Cellulomonas alba]MDM7854552.1 BTAD domain-containing putative transcriptional regulator [Cellulomonas alba]
MAATPGLQSSHRRGRVPAPVGALRIQLLGPLRLWRGSAELDPGPHQQAYLLALLLARAGRPTSVNELIDAIWGDEAPASALNVIHKYVGLLRRVLEPHLAARETGAYLVGHNAGYLCAAPPEVLDLARFRQLVDGARTARSHGDALGSFAQYLDALTLWSGPAGDGLTHTMATAPIFASLDDEYLQTCVDATEVALSVGRPDRVLPALHLAARMAPLHEPVQASLMTSLGRAGHQAEALAVFDRVRRRLIDDLGIDAGPALQEAHLQVVRSPALSARVPHAARNEPSRATEQDSPAAPSADRLVGRDEELAVLQRAIAPALTDGSAVLLLEGEPGVGKSCLLKATADHARGEDALVVWGHGLAGEGAPTMWPWVEAAAGLVGAMSAERRTEWSSRDLGYLLGSKGDPSTPPPIPDSKARFRLLEELVALIAESAAARPVVVVFDDLHWADPSSLQLLADVIGRLPPRTAVVGAFRSLGPTPSLELSRALAAASRAAGHRRVRVGPLDPAGVAELIGAETGVSPTAEAARLVHARTSGNPFFVRELARWLMAGGTVTQETVLTGGVPVTVRDVVRDRMATLDRESQDLLGLASLVGRTVELELLARAASLDISTCLERLEPARALGLMGPVAADPFSYVFTHDLVREAISEALPRGRAGTLHGRIANAIEEVGLSDESAAERVAHHLWASGPVADPSRTVAALVRAGARARSKTALDAAERHLASAVEMARRSSLLEQELDALSQLIAVVGMRSMYGTASVRLLERAEQVARDLGREREAAGFLFSRWTAHAQGLELRSSGPLARRLLEQGAGASDPLVRAYGEAAWGIHQWHLGAIGESYRRMSAMRITVRPEDRAPDLDPVHDALQLLTAGTFAEISAYHGDTAQAHEILDRLKQTAGDDPYALTVATAMAARTAAVVGDPEWALTSAESGISVDPHFSFDFLGTYLRLARHWALAMRGVAPASASDAAEELVRTNLSNPTRSCVSTWWALVAEMRIAAGDLDAAAAALDHADACLERHEQRTGEGLVVLVRAYLARAAADPAAAASLARSAAALSRRRGAHLFARRADLLLADLATAGRLG